MEYGILSTGIIESVSVAEMKILMGYNASDQDDVIRRMIQVAREWVENRTSFACVSKSYKAYFEKADALNDWYELPMSPVLSLPAITVSVCGVGTTFQQKGFNRIKIAPDTVIGTMQIGATVNPFYVEVIFQAGAINETANECIRRIVISMFNNREDGTEVSVGRLPYDTLRLIESIDQNTGL